MTDRKRVDPWKCHDGSEPSNQREKTISDAASRILQANSEYAQAYFGGMNSPPRNAASLDRFEVAQQQGPGGVAQLKTRKDIKKGDIGSKGLPGSPASKSPRTTPGGGKKG